LGFAINSRPIPTIEQEMTTDVVPAPIRPLTREQIEKRLKYCPRLPSLSTINSALRELLNADQRYTSQVAEIIRRDPSLTARLLRLVNSVYYGLSTPVNNIEEAVFYLGVRQIRQLVMVTPIIEDFQKLAGKTPFPWRDFWQHCIGTAILTREVISALRAPTDEVDYVAGLIHDVGKIAMAAACPEHFEAIYCSQRGREAADLRELERQILGLDHTELGALYLKSHNLPDVLVDISRFHHQPECAGHNAPLVAAVQIADLLVRHANIGHSGNRAGVGDNDWLHASGWDILVPDVGEQGNGGCEGELARANLKRSLARLPTILEGLV
jgi:putative nucleotidyltransferase with HDIG domain